jgi:hypothetical protein
MHPVRIATSAKKMSTHQPWTQLKGLTASIHSDSAHQLLCAARRIEIRLSTWQTTVSEP